MWSGRGTGGTLAGCRRSIFSCFSACWYDLVILVRLDWTWCLMSYALFLRNFLATLCLFGMVASDLSAQQDAQAAGNEQDEQGFVDMIVGDTFEGWEGDATWFRIEKGVILAGSLDKKIPHNFFLCTEKEYGDFELRLEAKLEGPGDNAGVQFRTAKIPESHEVSGYQADMGTAWNRPVWGALYDESRRNKMLAEGPLELVSKVLNKGGWNQLQIRCEGARIRIWLNGNLTVDYTEQDESIPRSGVIAVQIHGGAPALASYRKLRIKSL